MALKVSEVLELQSLAGMKPVSGRAGLDRIVCSCGIVDYEFAEGVEYHNDNAFEAESFVISSLLFAQNHQERILPAVQALYEAGTSAFAFKDVIFKELPKEVIDFSEKNGYPIFTFGQNLYFENIIYEIMDAVERDNTEILSEQSIRRMIESEISKDEVTRIYKGISLIFKPYAMGVYLRERGKGRGVDAGRILRNYYLSKTLKSKCLVCRYDRGIFILMTGAVSDSSVFEVILREALEGLSVDRENCYICRSGIYRPAENLDRCFRESYHACAASLIDGREYASYKEIGEFKYLVPLRDSSAMQQYAQNLLQPIMNREELFHTACIFVNNNGDVAATASACACHQNTIRYRVAKMKELIGAEGETDFEFYAELSAAVRVYLLKEELK